MTALPTLHVLRPSPQIKPVLEGQRATSFMTDMSHFNAQLLKPSEEQRDAGYGVDGRILTRTRGLIQSPEDDAVFKDITYYDKFNAARTEVLKFGNKLDRARVVVSRILGGNPAKILSDVLAKQDDFSADNIHKALDPFTSRMADYFIPGTHELNVLRILVGNNDRFMAGVTEYLRENDISLDAWNELITLYNSDEEIYEFTYAEMLKNVTLELIEKDKETLAAEFIRIITSDDVSFRRNYKIKIPVTDPDHNPFDPIQIQSGKTVTVELNVTAITTLDDGSIEMEFVYNGVENRMIFSNQEELLKNLYKTVFASKKWELIQGGE